MNTRDPKLVVLEFNEAINGRDIDGLSALLSKDHVFIDREGRTVRGKTGMIDAWTEFFKMFPEYRNTFTRLESNGDLVVVTGYAYWNAQNKHDEVIWTAKIEDDLVTEWRIYSDTEQTRDALRIR